MKWYVEELKDLQVSEMSPKKIPDSVLTNALTTHDAIDRLVSGIEEIERDFNPGKWFSNQIISFYV